MLGPVVVHLQTRSHATRSVTRRFGEILLLHVLYFAGYAYSLCMRNMQGTIVLPCALRARTVSFNDSVNSGGGTKACMFAEILFVGTSCGLQNKSNGG